MTSDRVLRAVPHKRAIALIGAIPLTLSGLGNVLAGHGFGWFLLVSGSLPIIAFALAVTVYRRPELRLTDSIITLSMPVGRPRTYDLRHCGEFRAFSYFGIPPRGVTFHDADSKDLFGRDPDLKRRFIAENKTIQSIYDLSAKELATLLNEYRTRALATPQPSS